jgi:hypothetical protein
VTINSWPTVLVAVAIIGLAGWAMYLQPSAIMPIVSLLGAIAAQMKPALKIGSPPPP